MAEPSNLADWLRAVKRLDPQNDELRKSISRLLGLQMMVAEKVTPAKPKRKERRLEPQPDPAAGALEQPQPTSKLRRRLESVLIPGNTSRNPAPTWLSTAHHLEIAGETNIRASMPLETLFPERTSRAILSGALATPSTSGPLNLVKVVEILSRAEFIDQIPQLPVPTLVRGVQLLIDRGESMQLFAADQSALRAALSRVVGRERTQVLYFENSPLWGAGIGPKDEWPEYTPPAPGTPVVALTDLGIAQPPGTAGLAGASDWRAFADFLARSGCPLLALVPYPRWRWPNLAKCMTILQWDRPTTAAVVRRAIPTGLRVAKKL